jgi:hypothetical protein
MGSRLSPRQLYDRGFLIKLNCFLCIFAEVSREKAGKSPFFCMIVRKDGQVNAFGSDLPGSYSSNKHYGKTRDEA